MNTFDDQEVICKENCKVKMLISTRELTVNAVVADNMIGGVEVILEMGVIDAHGGVAVSRKLVKFGELKEDVLPMCSLLAEAILLTETLQLILMEIVGL